MRVIASLLIVLVSTSCGSKNMPEEAETEVTAAQRAATPATSPAASASDEGATEKRGDPPPPAKRAGDDLTIAPGPRDTCPVCAMKPVKYPKFAAAIDTKDGERFYFCGTGCMFRSWLHPEIYLKRDKATLKRAVVREYMGGAFIDAAEAEWVAGSDVVGPMGPALVPLANARDAAAFIERHGSKHRFKMSELDDARWLEITGKPAIKEAAGDQGDD